MPRDFYATMAQVLPILLLALVFDSRFLDRLRTQPRVLRTKSNPNGNVRFWSKPRVRVYGLAVTTILILDIVLCIAMLAGYIPDSVALRAFITGGAVLVGGSLLVRIWVDLSDAARETTSD